VNQYVADTHALFWYLTGSPHLGDKAKEAFDEDTAVPEMHDRMIVGVARRLNAVCLTRDAAVIASEQVSAQWD